MNTEQERAELLPCPFCSSTNIEKIQISTPDREGVPTNLMCSDCGASGPLEYEQDISHAKADAAWNTRAVLQSPEVQALLAERDALRDALETMVEMVEMNGFGRDYAMDVARAAVKPYKQRIEDAKRQNDC